MVVKILIYLARCLRALGPPTDGPMLYMRGPIGDHPPLSRAEKISLETWKKHLVIIIAV